jgi:hypothetical protein
VAVATISLPNHHPILVKLFVAGETFDADRMEGGTQFQEALGRARAKYGFALCLCRPHPLKLQIRRREGVFHVALWPSEGPLHDTNCVFFRDDCEFAPAEERTQPIANAQPKVHALEFAIGFSRKSDVGAHRPGITRPQPQPSAKAPKTESDHKPEPTLRALALKLWELADLTRWHPKWSRDWGRARYQLHEAAQKITVGGTPLAARLFVPRPYREDSKRALNDEFERFKDSLAYPIDNQIQSGLIVAPVRKMTKLANETAAMYLRHLKESVGFNKPTLDFLSNNCKSAYRRSWLTDAQGKAEAASSPREFKHPEVIAFIHVELSSKGYLWCRGAWLMLVHPSVFIPANSPQEVRLVTALMDRGYQFTRQLSIEAPTKRTTPDWIVRHVIDPKGYPVPKAQLQLLSNGVEPAFLAARAALAHKVALAGMPTWTWLPQASSGGAYNTVPPLPPLDSIDQDTKQHQLDAIRNCENINYAYGSGPSS